ncbi:DNA-binding NtrC family response regulator [Rheinheimera pacifica]|uniref:sigma-54-dependent transcriptional regulator n=1 Tax=Rheinheimera pacifica TaxID=173990 RepID=UPI00216825B5|nr:sigma-54 dependent transcriptional regulator [Rheinheimera pacifica]MCS4306304.1 DNA-binding NtrC family response regulator [Rheinheimera pacifica]
MRKASPYRIAVVEDDPALLELLQEELTSHGYQVAACDSAEALLAQLADLTPDLVISDIRLPGIDGMALLQRLRQQPKPPALLLITAFGTVRQAVAALKQGADDFLTKPLDLEHLLLSVERLLAHKALQQEVQQYRQSSQQGPGGMIGQSRAMRRLYQQTERIAKAQGAVLILGESGSGKELVAQALHQQSDRAGQPFIAVNCAGIPAELMESEFFGHAAGAYTGARGSRAGLFKQADGGTLLLDEIAEMPLLLQAKLLRVLQEGRMRPVGGDDEVAVDVRIIAATHQNLEQLVETSQFRADLFFRLETFTLNIPPLRERADDLELLAQHFLAQLKQKQPANVHSISSDALDCLYRYPFPGNVRELQNALERAYTFAASNEITPDDLPERIVSYQGESAVEQQASDTSWPSLQQVQHNYMRQVLQYTNGNKQQAAEMLGITRRTLYRWLEEQQAEQQ